MGINHHDDPLCYYIAVLVYESSSDAQDYRPLYQESFLLVQAQSHEEAQQKALVHAQQAQTSYRNEWGETITWTLKTLVDVNALLYPDLTDGAELYARHFRNYQAYAQFDPLLSGETL